MEVIREVESLPMPPSLYPDQAQEPSKPPKLTMKVLYELIEELQERNRVLADRLDQLESCNQFHIEVAAAVQWLTVPMEQQSLSSLVSDISVHEPDNSEDYLLPRSKRHVVPKKKAAFWSLWFSSAR
ncbi:hypothetical protein [Paenibacillus puerhi]|uniref:hypothetical protein n=1 Tax=Paenibacillus puerhi TaxID=2692622 RepID=UPI00135C32B5|nr:hypothetical protein [Paenibacillus puerhi]